MCERRPDGEALARYTWDKNGRRTGTAANANDGLSTDPNPFRCCGEYFDSYTREYYLRNRDYEPSTGRFTQEDPAE